MGASNYNYILNHIHSLKGAIVEIGSSRGEGSTEFFAGLVYGFPDKFIFHTVDFSENEYRRALRLTSNIKNMFAHKAIGEPWLEHEFPKFNQKICYAYLDNADWNWYENNANENEPNWIKEQRLLYINNGVEYSNNASSNAHLAQSKFIHSNACSRCIIQFDDTWQENNLYTGKGGLAIPWLLANGWKIIDQNNHMSIALSNY